MTERICGTCNACCVHLHIEAFEKPPGTPCIHLVGPPAVDAPGQCSIHETRPDFCRGFYCVWLGPPGDGADANPQRIHFAFDADGRQTEDLAAAVVMRYQGSDGHDYIQIGNDESYRPDRLGMLFRVHRVGVGTVILAHEIAPGAAQQPKVQKLVESVSRVFATMLHIQGQKDKFVCRNVFEVVAIFMILRRSIAGRPLDLRIRDHQLYRMLEPQVERFHAQLARMPDHDEDSAELWDRLKPVFGDKRIT